MNIIIFFIKSIFLILLLITSIYGLDPFDRLRLNEKFYVASLNYDLSGLASPALYKIVKNADSSKLNISSNVLSILNNRTPKLIGGILFNGNIEDIYFHFEPVFFRKFFKKGELRIQIAKLDGRQTKNTFSRWNKVVLEQLKKAGIDFFSKGNLHQFN